MRSERNVSPTMRFRQVSVIVNPATRRAAGDIAAIVHAVAPADVNVDVRFTTSSGEAKSLARSAAATADLVVAVGGDGTVAEIATGILGSGIPLGIIPTGSTNIVARELGISTVPRDAAALLFGAHRLANIDIGRYDDRVFLHMAGAGFDSRFFSRTNRDLKRRVGWAAYVPAAVSSLRLPPSRFTIVADGRRSTLTSPLVLVANGRSIITPSLSLHSQIRYDDGWFDVLAFTATTPSDIASTLARLATMTLEESPFLFVTRAQTVTIDADPPLPIELDGDVLDTTPATFQIEPGALDIVAPRVPPSL